MIVEVPAEDWGDGGIMNWVIDEMNSNPDIVPSFLELLRVLPEVLKFTGSLSILLLNWFLELLIIYYYALKQEDFNYKIVALPNRHRKFENELASTMDGALMILTACLNIP